MILSNRTPKGRQKLLCHDISHCQWEQWRVNIAMLWKAENCLQKLPLKIVQACLSNAIVENSHCFDKVMLCFRGACYFKFGKEMISDGYKSISWPSTEPIHCATTYKPRKFKRTCSEFVSNLCCRNRPVIIYTLVSFKLIEYIQLLFIV